MLVALVCLAACTPDPARPAAAEAHDADAPVSAQADAPSVDVVGPWRATVTTPGGELPFTLELDRSGEGASLRAVVLNGSERIEPTISLTERELVIGFEHYDSTIRATIDGDRLTGTWVHTMATGPESMPFAAQRGATPRFFGNVEAPSHPVPSSIDGRWSAVFTNPGGSTFPGLGIFLSAGDRLEGTFLTETGDYRYLDGRYEQGRLELSCFDGAHSFLLRADVDASGSLVGDFWAMGGYHSTWTATAMAVDAPSPLADPASVVALSPAAKDGRFEFSFPDLDGNPVSHDAPRFAGKVVLVDIFGTWCPNCNDYAPLLARWHERYGPRGLELVGLAFEMTGDPKRDRTFVRRYAERYGIEFPLLLAGDSDKAGAAAALPTLNTIVSYPTTILIGRDGKVRRTHSGFSGPATGHHHAAMVATLEREIETLLDEEAPG